MQKSGMIPYLKKFTYYICICAISTGVFFTNVYAQDGKNLFKQNCSSCHSIGDGKVLGPDLANVNDRREKEWLISFIKSSQSMIKDGDEQAVELYNEYDQINMPDQPLSDEQIASILQYIKSESPEKSTAKEKDRQEDKAEAQKSKKPEILPVDSASAETVEKGKMLFTGEATLTNKGPACIACHHVKHDRIIGGGTLAKELTNSFTGAGKDAGINGLLKNPPFPAMKRAYENSSLTKTEIFQLKAFLKHIEEKQYDQHPRDYTSRMLYAGIAGALLLLGIAGMIWFKRKGNSVNQSIYDRQVHAKDS